MLLLRRCIRNYVVGLCEYRGDWKAVELDDENRGYGVGEQ